MAAPAYWGEACRHLMRRDRVMKKLIPAHPNVSLASRGDAFVTLARSIVGQQISVKAAQSVWNRFATLALGGAALAPEAASEALLCPRDVLVLTPEAMRSAGLSARKVEYLLDLARHFDGQRLSTTEWHAMEDEAVIGELVAVRGVGRWTAEMFLIFHLLRPNVLPLDDVGLINGISRCYFSGEPVSRSDAREVASAWAPFCSVATWYIWRSLEPQAVAY